ncbi:Diaminopimelate epimerase-like protein [Aspergillus sclerotiicarbonarius CBS 121057]|uniref:trans-L-3-hydroxyproline dehydratase n=1 Tax=Aspergillus sclerotiicarbonarius (strain CBS 121057 / IBT 28362) TaxID=1448318 RepID=A0A319EKY7_ASPSB|nr:Diaminopimelate epimerase-like protein [Aspergillus sclerotiicarbonarius CBS 121057]
MTSASSSYWIETEDWHTAGEPFRIVDKFPPGYETEGQTVSQRRLNILEKPGHPLDVLRQSLCHEPRGHADMYGGFIVPPNDSGALFGVLFWHRDGFSTACGHGTIALGYWAVAHNMVPVPENGVVDVVVDVPSGRVKASVATRNGKPAHAEFINVLSYQLAKDLSVAISSRGIVVRADLAFSGAVYATVDASQLCLKVEPGNYAEFIKLGREIKGALGERAQYGTYDLYSVIFYNEEKEGKDENGIVRQRSVTIFADGQVDRSPCGSGTCARLAILLSQGRVGADQSKLIHRSIVGTSFEADVISEETSPVEGFKACIPRVRGQANLIGQIRFWIDPSETVFPRFLLC